MSNPKGRKVPMPSKNQKPEDLLVFEIDRALQLLVDTCEATAKSMAGDFVPIDMMKTFKKTLIDSYRNGLKTNPNFSD